MSSAQKSVERAEQAANRAEQARRRQQRESDAARGVAPPLPGRSAKPVHLPQNYWGDRQRAVIGEFAELLPVIETVAALPAPPSFLDRKGMTQEQVDDLMNDRLTALLAARKIVVERLRKEI